jgi:3-dehydroquinate dehydratase type II
MRRVLILNGPNLDLLGVREPEIYGRTSLATLADTVRTWGRELGFDVEHFQSNHEGELVERVHDTAQRFDGIVINAGALTHYSFSLHDALAAVEVPAVEVHISNIRARESWRRHSVISAACVASIYGRGIPGYRWALLRLRNRDATPVETHRYGDSPEQKMDVRRPGSPGPAPLAVVVHGGLWRQEWASDTTETWAVELARRGWITANIEYRRLGSGGGWPESFVDVTTAFGAAAAMPGVDPEKLHVIGHSAGATMALWLSGQTGAVRPTKVTSVAGITDLVRARAERLGDGAIASIEGRRRPRPEESSPRHRLPTGVEVTLVSCLDDSLVDPSYATDYASAARQAGDRVKLVELESTHSAVLDPLEPALGTVIEDVADLQHP